MRFSNAISIDQATPDDAYAMWVLVAKTPKLDDNSLYTYLMLTQYFAETCHVAKGSDGLLGFVTSFISPQAKDRLFVWQVAVDPEHRRQGIASLLLQSILAGPLCRHIAYIEATITPNNGPSMGLFEQLAADWNAPLKTRSLFSREHFATTGHDPEDLIEIGPLAHRKNRSTTN